MVEVLSFLVAAAAFGGVIWYIVKNKKTKLVDKLGGRFK